MPFDYSADPPHIVGHLPEKCCAVFYGNPTENELTVFNVPAKHKALVQRTEQKVFSVFNDIEKLLENLPKKV